MAQVHEISFKGATDLTLYGELMLPEGNEPFPAVLLMPGSGPSDRDGNQPPLLVTDILKQTAQHLAKNGVATFRFDKRPVARYRSSWPMESAEELSAFFSFENHVTDAEAAFRAMSAAKEVDPKRCAILGHSEGGLFASWLAPKIKPKAVVLAATAGDTLVSVLRFQIGRNVNASSLSDEAKKAIIESNEEAMKSIVETGKLPQNIHPNLAGLYNPTALKLMRSYFTIDPTDHLAKYSGPVLVINGDSDIQVRSGVDAARLYVELKKRESTVQELCIVPGASHSFKMVKTEADPGFTGKVVPEFLEKLTQFLDRNLK